MNKETIIKNAPRMVKCAICRQEIPSEELAAGEFEYIETRRGQRCFICRGCAGGKKP